MFTPDVFPCSECVYGGCGPWREAVNYYGNDIIRDIRVRNRADCCALCRMNQMCWAWTTYLPLTGPTVPVVCWLKSSGGQGTTDVPATVSGIVTRYCTAISVTCRPSHGQVHIGPVHAVHSFYKLDLEAFACCES
jgi:hypothetical protein